MEGQGCVACGHGDGPYVVQRVRPVMPSQAVPEGVREGPGEAGVAGGGRGRGWGCGPRAVVAGLLQYGVYMRVTYVYAYRMARI